MILRLLRTLFAALVIVLLIGLPVLALTIPATASPPMATLLAARFGVAVLLIRTFVSIPYLGPLIAFLALMTLMASRTRRLLTRPQRE